MMMMLTVLTFDVISPEFEGFIDELCQSLTRSS